MCYNKFLISLASMNNSPLLGFFNWSFKAGKLPGAWKKSHLNPFT